MVRLQRDIFPRRRNFEKFRLKNRKFCTCEKNLEKGEILNAREKFYGIKKKLECASRHQGIHGVNRTTWQSVV